MSAILSGKFTDGRTFRIRLDEVASIQSAPTVLAPALEKAGTKLEDVVSLNIRLIGTSKEAGKVTIKAAPVKKEKSGKKEKGTKSQAMKVA
jgi:hypothetical protein